MTAITRASAKGGSRAVLRALMAGCFAVTLAGCYQTEVAQKEYPTDYRQRHPIVVREGAQNIDILLGRNRGGLTPSQRADVVSFANGWRKEAGSGIIIEVPKGGPTDHAASDATREIRSIFAAVGVPVKRDLRAQLSSAENVARQHQAELYEVDCGCGAVRRMAKGSRPIMELRIYIKPAVLEFRLRHRSATLRRWSTIPADLVQPRGEIPAYAPRRSVVLDKWRKGDESLRRLQRLRDRQNQRSRQMIKHAQQAAVADNASAPPASKAAAEAHIAPAPRISVQAFCETVESAAAVQAAGEDRRLAKAHVKIQMGGIGAAIEAFRSSPTPNVILIETDARATDILGGLDQLAEHCDAGTRVVVMGRVNDVTLYRELTRRGVSEYLMTPVNTIDVVRAVCHLFSAPDAKPVGRIVAIVGAKGGVGASTVAHNVAWAIGRDLTIESVVADLDLPFGTAGLDYNQDPPQGIADAVFSPDRVDTAFVDRLLSKCTDHLSLLAAPATLERVYDFGAEAFDSILDSLRATIPCVVLDVPHQWAGWTRRLLVSADEILVVAGPDLANLRNAKNLIDLLRASRPNDHHPRYCLNQVGVPKRPEISAGRLCKGA